MVLHNSSDLSAAFNSDVLVSVIITTYNRPRYLEITLKSVMEQNYKNIEVIVIDDGSLGDENRQICDHWPAVKYYKIKNTGSPIVPRNTGFSLSKGTYVAFLDDDDVWLSEKISRQVEILNHNPEYGLVHGFCKVIDRNGNETGEIIGRIRDPERKHGYVFDRMVGNFTVMMPTPLIRREFVERIGGFNEAIPAAGEDMEFFCHLSFYTKFYYVNEPLALYRIHGGNISENNKHYTNLPLVLFMLIEKLRQDEGLSKSRFRDIRNRLVMRQIELISDVMSLFRALRNCYKMNPFFLCSYNMHKSLLKRAWVNC